MRGSASSRSDPGRARLLKRTGSLAVAAAVAAALVSPTATVAQDQRPKITFNYRYLSTVHVQAGQPFKFTATEEGAAEPFTWQYSAPSWVKVDGPPDSATATISGTAPAAQPGTKVQVSITAGDGNQTGGFILYFLWTSASTTTTAGVSTVANKPPPGLGQALTRLDASLTTVIDQANKGTLKGDGLVASIRSLAKDKTDLVDSYFESENLFGVPADEVIKGFDDINSSVATALQDEALGTSTSVADVVRPLDQAERIDITVLESEFAGTGKAPAELQGEFVALHDQFTTVVDHALNGSLKGDTLDSATGDLEFQYNELIASNFRSQLLFGVKASLVIVFFGEIDANLVRATTEAGSGKSAKAVVFLSWPRPTSRASRTISPRRARLIKHSEQCAV